MNELVEKNLVLFLIDPKDLKVIGYNRFGRSIYKTGKDSLFFRDIVHPEDYPVLIDHLNSSKFSGRGKSMEMILRFRFPDGNWNELLFNHTSFSEKNHLLLGHGEVLISEKKKRAHRQDPPPFFLDFLNQGYCRIDMIYDLENRPIDIFFIKTNPAFEKQVKISNVQRKSLKEFLPDIEQRWFDILEKVLNTGKPVFFKEFSKTLDNSWFEGHAFPIGSQEFSHIGVLFSKLSMKDEEEEQQMTPREDLKSKTLKESWKLRESPDLLQSVFDTTSHGIAVMEPLHQEGFIVDFRYLLVNKFIRKQYNFSDEIIGKRYLELNPDANEIGAFEALKKTVISGKPTDMEFFYDREGFSNWFRITAKRKNGLLFTTLEDITKPKIESQQLKENIRFKKHLTGASPDIIMICNLYEEKIRYINRDLAPLPEMRKKDVLGMKLPDVVPFLHPRDRQKAMDFHNQIINARDKDILEMEFRLRNVKGKYMWFNVLGKVFMRNRKANVYEYMLLLRNIDKHIETQKALINAEKLSIKGEIARTLAHELRNPLASIGMANDILEKRFLNEPQTENYLRIIRRNTKVLNKLVTELITSSNYSPAVLEKKCLASILDDSLKMARDRIYLSGIGVKKNYKGKYSIHADEEKLKIALLNLIVNASEAMEPDEGILEIKISKENDEFVLTMIDNGCGLTKKQLEKLFDAFYTQKPDGLGVGLSSVKNILEEHDARIEVQSEPEKGTAFHLTFHCYE